ncbi:phage tail protein [Catenovulum sp. SM1970]|uniref:phage tail protein n=1 Tax=Marinifaba aquimaris TaxID=2741323 RepID=UPI001574E9E3|nr:tail fiber protein [Marinifaba aquimaris]NTS76405.1 phage tail protein [Marinifaba aquimaris]
MNKVIALILTLISGSVFSQAFIGEIRFFAGNFAPDGWALCDGQLLPINQNQALFSILGTTYGGDGRTTFALPDMRGRIPLHAGEGPTLTDRNLGEKFGVENRTLTAAQMSSHSHALNAEQTRARTSSPQGNAIAITRRRVNVYDSNVQNGLDALHSNSITSQGGGNEITNIQPSLNINCIIAVTGTFPSRS